MADQEASNHVFIRKSLMLLFGSSLKVLEGEPPPCQHCLLDEAPNSLSSHFICKLDDSQGYAETSGIMD